MERQTKSYCLDLPIYNLNQKVFELSSNFCIVLIQINIEESHTNQVQLHIKLIEKETKRFICMDKIILLELFQQLNQFESVNIIYPCTIAKDVAISVKMTSIPHEYQIIFQNNKILLDPITVKYLLKVERIILSYIGDVEYHHNRGRDEVDI